MTRHKIKMCRGKNCKINGIDMFAAEWKDVNESTVEKDPVHGTKVNVKWYEIEHEGAIFKFGCSEIAPEQYMFIYD